MIKYCLGKWDENKDFLRKRLTNDHHVNNCDYDYLVKLVIEEILNRGVGSRKWQSDKIKQIDDGDYQGTLLFLIPENCYQPSETGYLMTFANYGSCCCCDALQAIQSYDDSDTPTEQQLRDYMALCKDIITNTIKPYNYGWRYDEEFTEVTKGE